MNSALDYLIKDIETLARAKDPEALTQASELVEKYPNDAKAWSLRAYVFGRNGHWSNAIDDLTRAINICANRAGFIFSSR